MENQQGDTIAKAWAQIGITGVALSIVGEIFAERYPRIGRTIKRLGDRIVADSCRALRALLAEDVDG